MHAHPYFIPLSFVRYIAAGKHLVSVSALLCVRIGIYGRNAVLYSQLSYTHWNSLPGVKDKGHYYLFGLFVQVNPNIPILLIASLLCLLL